MKYVIEYDDNVGCLRINGSAVLFATLTSGEEICFKKSDQIEVKPRLASGTVTERELETVPTLTNHLMVAGNKNLVIGGTMSGTNVTIGDTTVVQQVTQVHNSVGDNVRGNKIVTHVSNINNITQANFK